jgi:DNA-binding PadR family transcriptional regulator
MMKTNSEPFSPLSLAAQHILLALLDEDRHGYGIMQEVARQSGGNYKLGSGTLYDNLEKLIEQGLVVEAPSPSKKEDPRRRYYRMTAIGRGVFAAEIKRLESMVRQGKLRLRGARPKEA